MVYLCVLNNNITFADDKNTHKMNKLTLKNKFTGILLCLLMLIVYLIGLVLYQNRVSVLSEINILFESAIVLDTEVRMEETNSTYSSGYTLPRQSSSAISIQSENITETFKTNIDSTYLAKSEKLFRVKQSFLLQKSPMKLLILDSLFKSALIANGINVNTAFTYTVNKNTQYSNEDTTIYTTLRALPAITAGVKSEIVLQAYVDVPFLHLKGRGRVYFIMLTAVFFLFLFLLGVTWYNKKLAVVLIEPIKEEGRVLIEIKENLLFDPEQGILYYNDNVKVSFRNYKLKLFILLLNKPAHFESSVNIMSLLWRHTATTAKLNTTIKRLRKDLEPIPDLTIISKNRGYQLKITTI